MSGVSGAGGSCWDPKIYGIYENNQRIRGRFVATVATDGRVKFVPAMYFLP